MSGQPLPEYDDIDEGPILPNTVTNYIEAQSDAEFAVRVRFTDDLCVGCGSTGQTGKRQKVVVLRELQRAIIYTTK